jgi:hypothetical protein
VASPSTSAGPSASSSGSRRLGRAVADQARHLVDELRQVDAIGARRLGARVGEHLAREVGGALRGAHDPLQPLAHR